MAALTTALDIANAAPGVGCFAISPSNTDNYTQGVARALYVGVTGNVALVNVDGTAVTWVACPAGLIIPVHSKRVNVTNTSASSLVGIL